MASDEKVTVYMKPTCTTCRRLVELLDGEGVPFERVDYFVEPLDAGRIRALLRKAGLSASDVLRTRGGIAEGLEGAGEERLVEAMAADPNLLQRPIVERGDRAVLARPVERVRELF